MKISIRIGLASSEGSDKPIRARVSYDGIRVEIRTGYVCPVEAWDDASRRMIPGTCNRYGIKAGVINAKISELESHLARILSRYELEGLVPDPELVREDLARLQGKDIKKADPSKRVSQLFDIFIEEQSKKRNWSLSTVNSYSSLKLRIDASKISNKAISSLNEDDFESISDKMVEDGLLNTTTKIMVNYLNSFLRWCKDKGVYKGKIIKPSLKVVRDENAINYLEWDEVLAMKDVELKKDTYQIARDSFCFQCFTGLRTIDVEHLTWDHVYLDADVPYIKVTTIKTDHTIRIELNDLSKEILNRYEYNRTSNGRVFPRIGAQLKNRYLPRIAKIAGIKGSITKVYFIGAKRVEETTDKADAISSHWGRHSFIVHALSIGISPIVVMSWTGHSSYDAMRPYINIVDKVKSDAMSKFNDH